MSSTPSSSAPSAASDVSALSGFAVTLRIISPSSELADLPVFKDLAASTTVGEVKTLVHNELVSRRWSSLGMRLIYRGRVLDADAKSLEDVFGINSIKETDVHTLHLVLRDDSGRGSNSVLPATQPAQNTPTQPDRTPLRTANQAPPAGLAQTAPPANPQAQTYYYHHQQVSQSGHPAVYSSGTGSNAANPWTQALEANRRATVELMRQHNIALAQQMQRMNALSNNGQLMNQGANGIPASTPPHQQELLAAEVQRIIIAAEAQPPRGAGQHGHPTQTIPSLAQRHNAASPQAGAAGQHDRTATSSGVSWGQRANSGPDVYILESPTGPRALLINRSTEAYYTSATPRYASQRPIYGTSPNGSHNGTQRYSDMIQQHNRRVQQQQQIDLIRQHLHHVDMLRDLQQQHTYQNPAAYSQYQHAQQAREQPRQQVPGQPPQGFPMGGQAHHDRVPDFHANLHRQPGIHINNPGAGFLAAAWPHVWLVARLLLFIWWFTSPDASWTRWATVVLLATVVFIANTGMLDGVAVQAWAPFRVHLDGLLPLANAVGERQPNDENQPNNQNRAEPILQAHDGARAENNEAAAATPVGRAGGPELNPREVAARLIDRQRTANGERLMNLARRLERFGILFLASLAPGIAERHVALMEEQERRNRRRIQELEEAEAAAAAAAATATATATAETEAEAQAAETATTAEGTPSVGQTAAGEVNPVAEGA